MFHVIRSKESLKKILPKSINFPISHFFNSSCQNISMCYMLNLTASEEKRLRNCHQQYRVDARQLKKFSQVVVMCELFLPSAWTKMCLILISQKPIFILKKLKLSDLKQSWKRNLTFKWYLKEEKSSSQFKSPISISKHFFQDLFSFRSYF